MTRQTLPAVQMKIDGIVVTVVRKKIKSMNLYVKPPDGHIRVSVPIRTSDQVIHRFVHSHLDWILFQQKKIQKNRPKQWKDGENVRVFGTDYRLTVQETAQKNTCGVRMSEQELLLTVPFDSTVAQRENIIQQWQRAQMKAIASQLLEAWAPVLGVHVSEWHIKRMKTKWGSCNVRAHRIWLNLVLAEQPEECVEYVVVHELCHLLEPSHNGRFWALMSQYLPDWKQRRQRLNAGPAQQTNEDS